MFPRKMTKTKKEQNGMVSVAVMTFIQERDAEGATLAEVAVYVKRKMAAVAERMGDIQFKKAVTTAMNRAAAENQVNTRFLHT